MLDAVIRIDRTDEELIAALLADPTLDAERFSASGIDGGGDLVTVVATLGLPSLTALVAVLRTRWARAQHVEIEVDGIKVKGASPDDVQKILRQLLEDRASARSDEPPAD